MSKQRFLLLEIKLPKITVKPIRAMETVMTSMHQVLYHPPDWWEKWIDGQIQLGINLEIASFGGIIHFYIRTPSSYRDSVEASIYSQYPEAEITEADDYTKYVPQSIPNKEWDLFGADYKMLADDHFPIRTYKDFETEHEVTEEQKVDPVATLLESFSKVKPGEQFWIQISAEPVSEKPLMKWLAEGRGIRDKLARRPDPEGPPNPIIQEAAKILITGHPSDVKKVEERDIIPPEMKLTPGEREIITKMEEKMSKVCFKTYIRFIYLGKRDTWFKPNFRLAFAFFNAYATLNLNNLQPDGNILTKIHKHWFLPLNAIRLRRHYLRCRKLFRNYIKRFSPFFPRSGGTFMLNAEEMASIFHFPSRAVAPGAEAIRVEAKKGAVPADLPTE